jgi:hypothetical protein
MQKMIESTNPIAPVGMLPVLWGFLAMLCQSRKGEN